MSARTAVLLLIAVAPAMAQFELQVVEPAGARRAPALYDLGSLYSNETTAARFRLVNTGSSAAAVSSIAVGGAGFSSTIPTLPVTLQPQGAVEFTVAFRAPDAGRYSAIVRAEDLSILVIATVEPRLTWRVEDAPLGTIVDFGAALRGSSARRRFTAINETGSILVVPPISIHGDDYVLAGPLASGITLRPHESVSFAVDFLPAGPGSRSGTLVLGDRSYGLTGTAIEPPLPKPLVSIQLPQALSAQQGTLVIAFDGPAATSGTGIATLAFQGPADPAVAFEDGSRAVTFPIAPGDERALIRFQTGTTAGTLRFTARISDASDQANIQIINAAPSITGVQGTKNANGLEIRITGFDNTRTAGPLAFTFYDTAGKEIAPGAIRVDGSAEFARYFAGSDMGGAFTLRALFPVGGDASQIASFDTSITSSAGATKSVRLAIP
jgi:hypothetical protein